MPAPTFESTSAGAYIVRLEGREIGAVGKVGRKWMARSSDFDLGEHPTRAAAVEALLDLDRT